MTEESLSSISTKAAGETAQQLAQADVHKDEFLAMLAHELRNPLAPLRNATRIMNQVPGPLDPDLEWARDVISRQVEQMSRMLDDLLDVDRITRGKVVLQKEPVEVATVLARGVEMAQPVIDMRKHHLTITTPPELIWVTADPARLAQVLANLLINAAKYTEEGGRIWLTVAATRADSEPVDCVLFKVRDSGVGIPADFLPHVFDLFSQKDRSLGRTQGGLGIGLTLVRSLVEMHGGEVRATSAGPGGGSEFVVCLPRLRETPSAAPMSATPNKAKGRRILVVDDKGDAAQSLAKLLRLMGHEVHTVQDGPSALEMARAYPPEVALLDIGLPGMDGLEVARRLRQDLGLTDALLVALTGYGQEDDRRRSQDAGIDAHLVKPVDLEALQALLARP